MWSKWRRVVQFLRKPRTSIRLWMLGGVLALMAAGGLGMVWDFYVGVGAMLVGLLVVTLAT